MKATWENALLAESDMTIIIEGNHYFPPEAVKKEYFRSSEKHSTCPWKGLASYYHVQAHDSLDRGDRAQRRCDKALADAQEGRKIHPQEVLAFLKGQ